MQNFEPSFEEKKAKNSSKRTIVVNYINRSRGVEIIILEVE